ncbi:MAG: hypothetical protein OJJ55_19075 [Rhodococcus sp.]|nr:hypothetical protein [Rhodococcus sp. (in: high G+C Gram-positive bacteria)]
MAERSLAEKLAEVNATIGRGKTVPKRLKKGERSYQQKRREVDLGVVLGGLKGTVTTGSAQDAGENVFSQGGRTLKSIGSNALAALSVPQATAWTLAAKASGKGGNISWQNVKGDFYKSEDGDTGFQNAIESFGVKNKWAQLGVGLVADPMWLVGGALVTAPLKGVKAIHAIEQGSKVVKASDAAVDAARYTATIKTLMRNAARARSPETTAKHVAEAEKVKKKLAKLKPILEKEAAKKAKTKDIEATDLQDLVKFDEFGHVEGRDAALEKLRRQLTKTEEREGMNYALRLGAGKFSKNINLGVSARRGATGRRLFSSPTKAGIIAMKPLEKVGHAIRRSGAEQANDAARVVHNLRKKFNISEADASALGVYRVARSVNQEVGERAKQVLIDHGAWRPEMDDLTKIIDDRNDYTKIADEIGAGDARPFDEKLTELEDERSGLMTWLERNVPDDAAPLSKRRQKKLDRIDAIDNEIKVIGERGPYTKVGANRQSWEERQLIHRKRVLRGEEVPGAQYLRSRDPDKVDLAERKMFDNPFTTESAEQFGEALRSAGIADDVIDNLVAVIDDGLKSKGIKSFAEHNTGDLLPEWNALSLHGRREQEHVYAQVHKQTEELIAMSGLGPDTQLAHAVRTGMIHSNPNTISGTRAGEFLRNGIAHLKGFLTFANPSHYVTNAWGDFWNRLINGDIRHLGTTAAIPKSGMQRLANAEAYISRGKVDEAALAKIHNIDGRDYPGGELLALSRMSGLGTGYVGTDIAVMAGIFEKAGNKPHEFYRFMQRMNIKRENAQRLETWVKHVKAGDDPITAATKTLRVHFDYTQLTEFEKLWARNLLLFYTWMKRNSMLQGSGMVTRPGLYNAVYNNFERTRDKFPNEPEYFAKQGAVTIPGLGNIAPGSPWADAQKWDLTWKSFRANVLGAVTPPVRVPVELAYNQNSFTGGRIQDYEGQKEPAWWANMLRLGTQTTSKDGGEKQYGVTPQLAYFISQFTGPQANTAQAVTAPDSERGIGDAVSRFLGLRLQENRPESFARSAKYIQAKKKADATRARNAQN